MGIAVRARDARWWLRVVPGVLLVVFAIAWFASTSVRCPLIEVRQSAFSVFGSDDTAVGLHGGLLDEVVAVARVESSGSEWIDVEGWDSCLRPMNYEVVEILWETDTLAHPFGLEEVPSLPPSGTVILPADTKTDRGEYFVFISHWDGQNSGVPTNWWANVVFDDDQHPPAGLDDLGLDQLEAIIENEVSPKIERVTALLELRVDLFQVEWLRHDGDPFWEVGPRLEALLRVNGMGVRDYIGAPDLETWLKWDPIDRRFGWTRNHLPEGAADSLDIQWSNGEVVVIHHTLTTDSVTHVGLLSSIGLMGPEALVPGGGEVSIRGQYVATMPLSLVLFDEEGDIALTYPVPESILRGMDERKAVAVDLDLRGAFNWRRLNRPPS